MASPSPPFFGSPGPQKEEGRSLLDFDPFLDQIQENLGFSWLLGVKIGQKWTILRVRNELNSFLVAQFRALPRNSPIFRAALSTTRG